ncbi:hypothetical protein GCM10009765_50870 [Fodinicola feengrottensis]|uniref:DUF1877 family protein n=1 Tax=Fodinicola feengrottensis TaxID=435914 RepID=A0ABN2HYS3_9ACTN
MASLGVHFMLTPEQDRLLTRAADDTARMAVVKTLGGPETLETDKAWDAIHRCLTDGTLTIDGGDDPLAHAVLGGQQLYESDDSFVSHITADQVAATAAALQPLNKDWLLTRYRRLSATDYDGPYDDDDFVYTWDNLVELRDFFDRAARQRRSVIFTVDM